MPTRRPYPSDLSDARWELVEPVLSAWRFERRGRALDFGRPPVHDLREIMNAILYVDRADVQWRYLPHDFPHWNTVYGYFAKWQQEGVFAQLNGLLRQLLREKEGRQAESSACVIDAQSVKTSTSVPAAGQGVDAGKKIVGRKRNIVTDTLGLLLAALVTAAMCRTPSPAPGSWTRSPPNTPASARCGSTAATASTSSNTPPPSASTWKSPPAPPGPGDSHRSRNGGRSNGPTAGSCFTDVSPATTRPCPPASEAMIHIAVTDLMARRLTGENTISWRDPTQRTKSQIPG
jgi:transposase